MPFLPSPLRLPAALAAALALGLCVQLALPAAQDAGPLGVAAHGRETPPPAPAPLGAFAAVTARPVFSPDRTAGGQAGASVAAEGQLALAGVGSGPGGGSATLRSSDGVLQTIGVGQAVRGWRLVMTAADSAILERDGTRQVLHLGSALPSAAEVGVPVPSPAPAAPPPPSVPPHFSVHGSR